MNSQARLLFWLLVAATIAVDVAAIVMLVREGALSRVVYVYDALTTSQLAVVCIWARFTSRPAWFAWLGVLAAVVVCSVLGFLFGGLQRGESFGLYGSFSAVLAFALWLVGGTTKLRELARFGSALQFSLGQLLAAMTVIALLVTVLRTSDLLFGSISLWQLLAVLTVSDVLVVLATLLAWMRPWYWLLRLAASLGMAMAIGVIQTVATNMGLLGSTLTSSFQNDLPPDLVGRIILTVVTFAWLEIGGIVPVDRQADATPPAGDAS